MNFADTKVSIVVPIYNVEKYLERCLHSLATQTLDLIEIILVDDGSTDDSSRIAREFAQKYDYVHYLKKENGGMSDARNYGLVECKGQYVGFIDSDDYVEPDMFEKMYHEALLKKADVVSCDYVVEYPNRKKMVCGAIAENVQNRFFEMKAAPWNKIYRLEWLKELGVNFPKGLAYEDTAFFCNLIPHIEKLGYVNKPFVHYVQRKNSISNTQGKINSQIFDIFNVIIEYYKAKGIYELYHDGLEFACARVLLGSSLIRISKISDARLRDKMVNDTFDYLKINFANWRNNVFISKSKLHYRVYFSIIQRGNALLLIKLIQ